MVPATTSPRRRASTRQRRGSPAFEGDLEEPLVQIALPPRIRVDGGAIEPVRQGRQLHRNGVAHQRFDLDPLLRQLAALAADLVAALAAQAAEVVVEAPEAAVHPVVLVTGARKPAARRQGVAVRVEAEVDVHRREALLRRRRASSAPAICVGDRRVRARRRQDARSRDGREGYRDQQLRVVPNSRPLRRQTPSRDRRRTPPGCAP